jgi:transposase
MLLATSLPAHVGVLILPSTRMNKPLSENRAAHFAEREAAAPLVDDELWSVVEPLLPQPKGRRLRHPGRKPLDRRKALSGILFVLTSGIPWELLPREADCGSGMSCWRYLRAWQRAGVWEQVQRQLRARLREVDGIDFAVAIRRRTRYRRQISGEAQEVPPALLVGEDNRQGAAAAP